MSLSSAAMAQQAPVETVVVTGSRIPQVGLYSSSPVTAVNQTEMKLQGTTSVETLLNNLPGVFGDFTQTASNGATGQATVDLRGLGSQRTLVLIDGKRLMPSDPSNPVADLNQVPADMVDHVEVLTGGASAVYGSDALGGVVNFIMRKDFEGIEVDGQYSINNAANDGNSHGVPYSTLQKNAGFPSAPSDWWGGATTEANLIMGVNTADGKGNITGYMGYRDIQAMLESARDFSACSLTTSFSTNLYCSGSSNYNRWISWDDLLNGQPGQFFGGNTNWVPYHGSDPTMKFNYGPLNYLQRPDVRYDGGFFGHYQVSPMLDVYSNFMFADDHTLAQIAPSGAFLGSGPANFPGTISPGYVQVNCDNPLMTAQQNQLLCGETAQTTYGTGPEAGRFDGSGNFKPGFSTLWLGRRDIEGGNRIDDLRHTSYRLVVGGKGDLGHGWSYDVYGQFGETVYQENYQNEWSKQRLENGLNVDPTTGNCVAADLGIDTRCVPIDLFHGFGAVTPDQLKYVVAQGFKEGFTQEQVVSGSITGDLGEWGIQTPWSKSPFAIALGAEYRQEQLQLDTSRDFQINDLYGQGSATLPVPKSGFNVTEGFGELQMPIVQDKEFFQSLTLNAGYRYSDYSTAGAVSSYKYGFDWQPIDDFRLRGSYQRAVRAPTVLESFAPLNVALFGGQDPCAGGSNPKCVVGGQQIVAQPCPSAQCNAQFGGNIALRPESSDTWSIGVVLTPTFIDGFTATIDYFDIKVKDYISFVDPNVALAGCYGPFATAAQQGAFCPLIHRTNGGLGSIFGAGFVDAQNTNLNFLKTTGIDFEANYQTQFDDWGMDGWGGLSFNLIGTLLNDLSTSASDAAFLRTKPDPNSPIGASTAGGSTVAYQCAGLFGVVCGTPSPKWRHKMRVTWTSPWDLSLSLDWRHLSGVKLDANTTDAHLNSISTAYCAAYGICGGDKVDSKLPSEDYFDIAGTWTARPGLEFRAGVNNVFDKNPPTMDSNTWGVSAPPFGNGNTFPGVYDALGRTFFVGVTAKY